MSVEPTLVEDGCYTKAEESSSTPAMESGNDSRPTAPRTVAWRGDWDLFKEEFIAAAECSGTGNAVELAEKLAAGEELEDLTKNKSELVRKGRAESRRLNTQITLSLIATQGAQQMLVRGGLQRDMDGIGTWVRLIRHFECTVKGQRTQELHSRWESETLQPGENPELLYIRLATLQRQLAALGDNLSQSNLTRKFLAAVRNGDDKIYGPVIREYNRDLVRGRPLELNQLLELLALEHRQAQQTPENSGVMTGLAVTAQCTYYKKMGHHTENCWSKHPSKRPPETRKCYKCGKVGHLRRNCESRNIKEDIIATQAMNGQVERVQGILINNMRAVMRDTDTPTQFWPLAIQHAAWIYNRTPNRALRGQTPWEVATGKKPDMKITRVFGCKAFAQIPKDERRGKTQNPTWQGILVGYSETSPEWILLDPKSLRLRNAFHVSFDENTTGWTLIEHAVGNRNLDGTEYGEGRQYDEGGEYNETSPIVTS